MENPSGQKLLVTSTGAQAAERLAGELGQAGVAAEGYSTRALEAAVERGAVALGPNVTIVHDEAALASTREQAWLLDAAARCGARVIEVGDPRQSRAVGAGGLWPAVERAAGDRGALVELSRIVRAREGADRRDQRLWRAGEHERALAGYAARGRVLIEGTQQRAEDRALEAAHADRQAGKSALVVVQTSNEALDALNARAQALRAQDGELGRDGVALRQRPYELRSGDALVLRAASQHPELGPVRNGTRGEVLRVAGERARVRLADGREAVFSRGQLDAGDARLAYVSHTFPAQGQTVDCAHVLADRLADDHGSYVALTRARERTHLYASAERLEPGEGSETQLASLARQLGRSELELPSISIALAHERQAEREATAESDTSPASTSAREATRRGELAQARSERDQARAELEQARVTRTETAAVLAGEPCDQRAELARASAERRAQDVRLAQARGEQLAGELAGVGRLARLGERGRTLKTQIAAASKRERDALAEQRSFSEQADAREATLRGQRREWDARHPGAHERHHDAEAAHELAEARHQQAARRRPLEAQLDQPGRLCRAPGHGGEGAHAGRSDLLLVQDPRAQVGQALGARLRALGQGRWRELVGGRINQVAGPVLRGADDRGCGYGLADVVVGAHDQPLHRRALGLRPVALIAVGVQHRALHQRRRHGVRHAVGELPAQRPRAQLGRPAVGLGRGHAGALGIELRAGAETDQHKAPPLAVGHGQVTELGPRLTHLQQGAQGLRGQVMGHPLTLQQPYDDRVCVAVQRALRRGLHLHRRHASNGGPQSPTTGGRRCEYARTHSDDH